MPEWLKGADCKSAGFTYVGSNPTRPIVKFFCAFVNLILKSWYITMPEKERSLISVKDEYKKTQIGTIIQNLESDFEGL